MLRKERKDSSMRSLSYFIDVLAIIAFMYILQAQDQAESTEVIISEKEAQIAGYAKEIDFIRKFDPKKTQRGSGIRTRHSIHRAARDAGPTPDRNHGP